MHQSRVRRTALRPPPVALLAHSFAASFSAPPKSYADGPSRMLKELCQYVSVLLYGEENGAREDMNGDEVGKL